MTMSLFIKVIESSRQRYFIHLPMLYFGFQNWNHNPESFECKRLNNCKCSIPLTQFYWSTICKKILLTILQVLHSISNSSKKPNYGLKGDNILGNLLIHVLSQISTHKMQILWLCQLTELHNIYSLVRNIWYE